MTKEEFDKLGLTQGQPIVIVLINDDKIITYCGYISHNAGINYCDKSGCPCIDIHFYTLHHSPFLPIKNIGYTLDLRDIKEIFLVKLEKAIDD